MTRDDTPIAQLRPARSWFVSKEELRRGAAYLPAIDGAKPRAELDEFFDQDPHPKL